MRFAWKMLLQSRKFWVAVLGVISGIVLYVQGALSADQLSELIVALMAILIGGIAAEDAASKWGRGR